jgi:outer membrane protein OmpA-like peptidoglycan-associated protein
MASVSRRAVLVSLVALALPAAGCLATKPYVRTEVQRTDARTQQQLETVDRRLDAIEHELDQERTRLGALEADIHQVRAVAEETAKQGDQIREMVREIELRGADAARTVPPTASSASAPKTPEPVTETLVVHFGFGQWQLDNPSRLALLKAVKRLRENPALMVKVVGHADNVGSPSQNLQLSQRRADEVGRFLIESGIKRNRIQTLAIGEARPVASNRSPTGRDQNRRVAITLLTPTR